MILLVSICIKEYRKPWHELPEHAEISSFYLMQGNCSIGIKYEIEGRNAVITFYDCSKHLEVKTVMQNEAYDYFVNILKKYRYSEYAVWNIPMMGAGGDDSGICIELADGRKFCQVNKMNAIGKDLLEVFRQDLQKAVDQEKAASGEKTDWPYFPEK